MKLKFSFESSVAATAAAAVSARPSLLHWNSGKCGNKKCGKKTKNVAKRQKMWQKEKKVGKEEKKWKKKKKLAKRKHVAKRTNVAKRKNVTKRKKGKK